MTKRQFQNHDTIDPVVTIQDRIDLDNELYPFRAEKKVYDAPQISDEQFYQRNREYIKDRLENWQKRKGFDADHYLKTGEIRFTQEMER